MRGLRYATPLQHLMAFVSPEPNSGCWLWMGTACPLGYGRLGFYDKSISKTRKTLAHRLAYQLIVGDIPEGLELDHKCRVPSCVNPQHLEPVTHRENLRRGVQIAGSLQKAKTHCPQGHEYSPQNTMNRKRGWRHCRTCQILRLAKRRLLKKHQIGMD